jgi:hypothetical protein
LRPDDDGRHSCNPPLVGARTAVIADGKDPAQRLDAPQALDRVSTRSYYVIPLYSLAGQ